MFSKICNEVFAQSIQDYHVTDHIDAGINNPHPPTSIEHLLYKKNWIDTVQWHLEDIIREPSINPDEALKIKRRIDASNQERTDMVEFIDSYFLDQFKDVEVLDSATINTESPAWAIDRLSILALKIYHMAEQANRAGADEAHRENCAAKLSVLQEQQNDLSTAIDQLLNNMESGMVYMKVYKQMKMYNDPNLNPVLYGKGNG